MAHKQSFLTYLKMHFADNYAHLAFKFETYATILAAQNKVHNLTALPEEDYYEKHFLDSILLQQLYEFKEETLIDVGSGAGFPGLVLAIIFPSLKVTLLEPTKKRCDFLKLIVNTLSLTNVTIVNKRAEDFSEMRENFDLATSRAVASLPILLELSVPLIRDGGSVLVMKGKNFLDELVVASNAIHVLKVELGKTNNHFLPSDGSMRTNARFIKKGETNAKYPRPYGQIKKKPL